MKHALTLLALFTLNTSRIFAANLTVNAAQTYQTIAGYGVNVNTGWWNNGEVKPAIDMLVDQLGATIFRSVIEEMDWEAVNDNSDPNVFNWTYYNSIYSNARFQGVWNTLRYLNQKGIVSGLVISFMGQPPAWMGGNSTVSTANEDEFVETMASLLYYARNTAGINFTLLSPINEPDTGGVEGPNMGSAQMARVLHKLAIKLDAIGMSDIRFVAPEAAGDWTSFFNAIVADPVIMAKLACWGVHNYGSGAGSYQGTISASAYPNKPFWVTETATFANMLGQIPGNPTANLVWDGFDSIYQHAIRAGRGSTPPNDSPGIEPPLIAYNTTTHLYTPRKGFYEHAQLFKFVAPGAVRIGATDNDPNLTAYAFSHPTTGRLTIVGRNANGNAITVNGTLTNLPAAVSTLELYRTNPTLDFNRGPDVAVSGGTFSLSVPANTYFTLTSLDAAEVTITNPVNGATFNAPSTIPIDVLAIATTGSVAKVEFFSALTKIGEATNAPFSFTWTNVAAGTYALTVRATDSGGSTATSGVVNITVAGPLAGITVTPTNVAIAPGNTQQFSALGSDASDRVLNPQPLISWSASGGGTITSNGLFTAAGSVGGPFSIYASSAAITGTATVNVVAVPPVITLTVSGSNASFYAPALLTLSAALSGDVTAITNVEFYAGATKIGADATAPYSLVWPNVPVGGYTLTARADGSNSLSVTSVPVTITVTVPGGAAMLGNTNEGNATDTITDNSGAYINACRFQAPSNVTVTLLHAKVGAITGRYQCAIYSDNNGNASALLSATATLTNVMEGWQTFPLTSGVGLTNGGYYWLAIWSDDVNARVYADTGGVERYAAYPFGTWPNPVNLTGSGGFTYCIYATGPMPTAYQQWKSNYGLAANTPNNADTDHDGVPLLLEYTYGLDPLVSSTSGSPTGKLQSNYLTLTYQKIKAATDITCIAEVAADLTGPWLSGSNDVEQLWQVGDGLTTRTITARDNTPLPNATSRFMRLQVTQP